MKSNANSKGIFSKADEQILWAVLLATFLVVACRIAISQNSTDFSINVETEKPYATLDLDKQASSLL